MEEVCNSLASFPVLFFDIVTSSEIIPTKFLEFLGGVFRKKFSVTQLPVITRWKIVLILFKL